MSDEMLRMRAREAVLAGRLPNTAPERIWGGPGTGARCAVCDEPIEPSQPEFELEFVRRSQREPGQRNEEALVGHPGDVNCHVHVGCFAAWESERQTGDALLVEREAGMMNRDEC